MSNTALPIAKTVRRRTRTTVTTTRVTLTEEQVAQILRERYGIPDADARAILGY